MTSRRSFIGIVAGSLASLPLEAFAMADATADEILSPLDYPPFDAITKPSLFGLYPPTKAQKDKARDIISNTPSGPRPIDIAQSFIDRFGKQDPDAISQWPAPQAWNPLIVSFFSATTNPVNNDTVPWCAAFMNWCLQRAHRPTTKSASSQDFATTKLFSVTDTPVEGDIVVFTCYDQKTNKSLGIGHVTFFKKSLGNQEFMAVGGNQSGATPSMISEKAFPYGPFNSRRHVGGKYIPVTYKINRFLKVT